MIHQKRRIAPILMMSFVGAVFAFSLYVLLTTENTIIVVNEAASEPQEVFVSASNPPASPIQGGPAPEPVAPAPNPRIQILETSVGFLNVRDGASTQAKKIGTVKPGEVYEYTETKDNWYHIVHPSLSPFGGSPAGRQTWVFGEYVKVVVGQQN